MQSIIKSDQVMSALSSLKLSPARLKAVLALLADDFHCVNICVLSFEVDVQTGKVSGFTAKALNRDRSAGVAPGDILEFGGAPEGVSDDIKAAKRGCYAVRVCWRGERVSNAGFVDGDNIEAWREFVKDDRCCKDDGIGELL